MTGLFISESGSGMNVVAKESLLSKMVANMKAISTRTKHMDVEDLSISMAMSMKASFKTTKQKGLES